MSKERPELLQFLEDELDMRVRRHDQTMSVDTFLVDLSGLRLSFSDRSPVLWIRAETALKHGPHATVNLIRDVVRSKRWRRRTPLVLLDAETASHQRFVDRGENLVFIDTCAQRAVLQSPGLGRSPTHCLLDTVCAQLPISVLAPYEITSPVTGSRFFGREFEIRKLLQKADSNFAISGIRRIGKTSLLQEVRRRMREIERLSQDRQRVTGRPFAFLDCSGVRSQEEFIQEIVRQLDPRELSRLHLKDYAFYFPNFLKLMSKRWRGRIPIFLDEVDELLQMDRDHQLLKMLRAASNGGWCRLIMAGFRHLQRAMNDISSPLHNFVQPLRLAEFGSQEADDLITIPLINLRVRFENQSQIVKRIYNESAGQPNIIQHYCLIIMNELDRSEKRTVNEGMLSRVYDDPDFRSRLLTTFSTNTDDLEKAVVYSLLNQESPPKRFGLPEIDATLRRVGFERELGELEQACDNLELAGVLFRNQRQYSFTTHVFPMMLQRYHNIDYRLKRIKDRESQGDG